jgi:hypothetical protein
LAGPEKRLILGPCRFQHPADAFGQRRAADAAAFIEACGELRYWPREAMMKS